MKTIIAPTDFSKISENACLYAALLAAEIKADIILLHVMELPVAVAEYPLSEVVFDEATVEKKLDALKYKLLEATHYKLTIRTKNVLGSAEHEIKELCKTEKPFAVVISTNSYSAIDRFFLGSTTIYSARHLRYPVIVVPNDMKYQPIKRIGMASDLKDIYEVPVEEIEKIIKLFNAELEVFYAAENDKIINRNSVDSLLLGHRLLNLNPQFYVVKTEDIMIGITSMAQEHQIDLLIIISKKHGPFHKSQTKDFILHSNIPVMAIHENDLVSES